MSAIMSKRGLLVATLTLILGASLTPGALAQGRRPKGGKKPAAGADATEKVTIVLTSGRQVEGCEIKEEKFAAIKYRPSRGPEESVKGEDVADILFDDPNPSYASGLSQLGAGLYERAVKSFGAAKTQAKDDSLLKVHATFYLGEALRGAGSADPEKGSDMLKAAAEEYAKVPGDHWLAPQAAYGLGLALAGAGKQSEALASFKKLDNGFGDRWRYQGKLGEGMACLALKKAGDARQAFEIANSGASSRYPELAREAQVGIGKAYVMDKRYDDAVKFFDKILDQRGVDAESGGGAWAGKGDCRYAQAQEKSSDKGLLQEALLAYLTSTTRYAGSSSYARSLYMAAEIYKKLGLPDQAENQAKELRARFPDSSWAKKLSK